MKKIDRNVEDNLIRNGFEKEDSFASNESFVRHFSFANLGFDEIGYAIYIIAGDSMDGARAYNQDGLYLTVMTKPPTYKGEPLDEPPIQFVYSSIFDETARGARQSIQEAHSIYERIGRAANEIAEDLREDVRSGVVAGGVRAARRFYYKLTSRMSSALLNASYYEMADR